MKASANADLYRVDCAWGEKTEKSLHYKTALITGNRQSRKVQRIQDVDVTKSPGQ